MRIDNCDRERIREASQKKTYSINITSHIILLYFLKTSLSPNLYGFDCMSLMDPRHSDNDPVLYSATAGGDKYIPCSPSLFSPSLDMVNGGDVGIRDEMTPIINDANEAIDSTPYASSRNWVRSESSACSIRDFDEDDQRLAEVSLFRLLSYEFLRIVSNPSFINIS